MSLAMIRIALLGSRSAWGRLAGIAGGVAVGTAMFILLLGAYKGLERRDDRAGYLQTIDAIEVGDGALDPLTDDNALLGQTFDYYSDREINHVDIAVTASTNLWMPGIERLPGPGEYLVSPALARLIAALPPDQLGDRYGAQIGTIPNALLESPDTLAIIVGHTEDQMLEKLSTVSVTDLSHGVNGNAQASLGYQIIVIIGAIGMFFPVLLFISIVTQLGAVQRQERFASLRLIGASPQTVSWFAATETALTGGIGAIAGVAIALLFRPIAADTKVDGKRFFESDFAVGAPTIIVAILGMVVVSTLAASVKIRRTGVSPINTVRDLRESPPSFLRCVPLLAGLSMIVTATLIVRANSTGGNGILVLFVGGFILLLAGIVLIGPFLTLLLSRLLSRFSRSAATLIASRRISAIPSATFRSVSGLVVAVFIVTVFAGSASAVSNEGELANGPGVMPENVLVVMLGGADLSPQTATIAGIEGVDSMVPAYIDPTGAGDRSLLGGVVVSHADAEKLGFTNIPASDYVSFPLSEFTNNDADTPVMLTESSVTSTASLMTQAVFIVTDGESATVDRVRTVLASIAPEIDGTGLTRANIAAEHGNDQIEELKVLAYLGVILSILIAGSSLAIATACAMLDRKRILGLMRLMGMPEGNLRKIVTIEAAVPLLAVLGMVITLGFGVAWCIIEGTSDYSIGVPDRYYFLSILLGLTIALGMIAATFGLIRRNTLVTVTRFE